MFGFQDGIFVVSFLIVGFEVVLEAIENILKGEVFDENFLMSIATIGAFAIGEFPEGVAVMLFYQVGELFQSWAIDRSKKSIATLMDIRPDFANVKRDGKEIKVSPDEVEIGESIVVKPGEKVPLDGKVTYGSSMLDTSSLTGEPVPREVKIGDEILSGCINQNGLLIVQVTKVFGESTVSKILDLVENASNKKSKSENFISKFAKVYTPLVVLVALLLCLVPPMFLGFDTFSIWLYRALSFLVVSCPCALVISIPLGFFGGIGGCAKTGILVKGSNYLEALSHLEMLVFDKTGTLTEGSFEARKVEPVTVSEDELLRLASYAEGYSNHPIAVSVRKAYSHDIDFSLISKTEELSGLGVLANVDGKEVLVGNSKLMEKFSVDYSKCDDVGTVLYVAIDGVYAGFIVIADQVKKDSKVTVQGLKDNSVSKVVMLTGDRKAAAESVARSLGIDEVYSELLPGGKAEKLESFMEQKSSKGAVAFVGDGMNDAPVLALADVRYCYGGFGK